MSRLPLLLGAVLVIVAGGVAAVLVVAPTESPPPDEVPADRAVPETTGDDVVPARRERKRVQAPPSGMHPAAKSLWAELRRALRGGRTMEALAALERLRVEHPEAVPVDAPVVPEIENAALDLLAAAEASEARPLLTRLRRLLRLEDSRERLRELAAALAPEIIDGLSAEESLVVAAGGDDGERDDLTRHLRRFGPETPGVDRSIASPDWVDATIARVTKRISRRKTPVVPLLVADVDAAEKRRLEQLEKLRQREAVHLLDHIHAGLAWLALHQNADGSIDDRIVDERCKALGHTPTCRSRTRAKEGRYTLAATALTALAFLDFRDQDARALFEPSLSDAIHWLRSQQKKDGSFGVLRYEAPIALMALGQAASSSGDPELVAAVEKGWAYHARVAGPLGGYRYGAKQAGDLSVTGWYVQAYEAATAAGVELPGPQLGLSRFVAAMSDGNVGYGYTSVADRPSLRSVGMLSQHILSDEHDEAALERWRAALAQPWKPNPRRLNLYSLYYDVRLELLLDGTLSEARRDAVTDLATEWQEIEGDAAGMFNPTGRRQSPDGKKKSKNTLRKTQWIGSRGGTAVFTAFSVLTLEHALYRR